MSLDLADITIIGHNGRGPKQYWEFGVGRIGSRWVGFAVGGLADGSRFLNLFPNVSPDGVQMGLTDRDRAIRLTAAIAQDPDEAFGGVAVWFVDESLRGDPEQHRCSKCGDVGCGGWCEDDVSPEMIDDFAEEQR